MGFDLKVNNLTDLSEAGFEFELEFPGSFEPTGAFVTVRGANSPKVKAQQRKKQLELEDRKRRNRNKDEPLSIEEMEDLILESAIVRVKGWKGIDVDGKPFPFNEQNVRELLAEHEWIREQVLRESEEVGNFTRK